MKYHHPMGFKKWKLTYMSWFSRHLLLFLKMQQVVYWWACSEEKDELELWLDHTNILHNGLRLRLWCRDVTSDSVFLSISHMTWTSSYPQVCISSWSFKSPAPFFRALTRAETANQTRLTGNTILCHQSSITLILIFNFFLRHLPPNRLNKILNPARPISFFFNSFNCFWKKAKLNKLEFWEKKKWG